MTAKTLSTAFGFPQFRAPHLGIPAIVNWFIRGDSESRAIEKLREMSDERLDDIGISRDEVERVLAGTGRFW